MDLTNLKETWDLESIFPGGGDSPELHDQLKTVEREIDLLGDYTSGLTGELKDGQLVELVDQLQKIGARLGQISAFIGCLNAQDVKDGKARLLEARLGEIRARLAGVYTSVDQLLADILDESWGRLLEHEKLRGLRFPLDERRRLAGRRMGPKQERLAADLAVDGYHAWSRLYDTVVGAMSVEVEVAGESQVLSVGQASNLLSQPDSSLRRTVFEKLEEAWSKEAELCAGALNHLAGFRLNLYKHRGWDDVLWEPLQLNRMERATLDAMWAAVEGAKPSLSEYLQRKAELLCLEQIGWSDLDAPLGGADKKIPFADAAAFIVAQLDKFSPELADFTQTAFEKRWVEAENRGGKRPGAFCTSFPLSEESRVFMTYGGTIKSVGTLAHELGHAYHGHVLRNSPLLLRRYAMNVAETASTFGELLVVDGAIEQAAGPEEKLGLLEDKISRAVAFLMDIHARFLFETRFYQARKKSVLSVEQLNGLMLEAQKEAFSDSLEVYHPHFWASKLHFYITGVPFYNFPYTFGYLFSAGVYARAKAEGKSFAQDYRKLLLDTARMSVEDLARKHLGADLTKPEFWESAVQLAVADIAEFLKLTDCSGSPELGLFPYLRKMP